MIFKEVKHLSVTIHKDLCQASEKWSIPTTHPFLCAQKLLSPMKSWGKALNVDVSQPKLTILEAQLLRSGGNNNAKFIQIH